MNFLLLTPDSDVSTLDLSTTCWKLPPLYKANRFWMIQWDIKSLTTSYGTRNGKVQTDQIDTTPKGGKTVGEQAYQEALHRFDLKSKEGFCPENSTSQYDPEPMLAKIFLQSNHTGKKKANEVQIDVKHYPVMVQPKLDGVRLLAKRMSDGTIRLRSRSNNAFPFLFAIKEEIGPILAQLPVGTEIDGECYTQELTFERITGITRKSKTPDPLENKLKYFIFDIIIPENPPYERRYEILYNLLHKDEYPHLQLVRSYIANTESDILNCHLEFTQSGYEGTMIRILANSNPMGSPQYQLSLYQSDKRSNGLLKYKDFQDSEMKIVDVVEGTGTEKGLALMRVQNPFGRGESEFVIVRPRSSFEQRQYWFQNPETVIGKQYIVRYQEITSDGNLRFPVGVAIRDYE